MRKLLLTSTFILVATTLFAQKPKSMRELRDSIFTVMKLSDENRKTMHELIAKEGEGRKAINENPNLNEAEKKQKSSELIKSVREIQGTFLTPEQHEIWKQFVIEVRKKSEAAKK